MLRELFARKPLFLGDIPDPRPESEKIKDYTFQEIVASADPVKWVEMKPTQWRRFSIRNQANSSSCVAQAGAKILGVLQSLRDDVFIDFSASFIYQRRGNKQIGDGEGMWGTDAFEILRKNGATLDALMPSQDINEIDINKVPEEDYDRVVASAFRIGNYVVFDAGKSFDEVASTIQKTNKAVMVNFAFDRIEWTDIPNVQVPNPRLRHSVTAVDAVLFNGVQYLVIEDSWGDFGRFKGQRLISRDFYQKRNTYAGYPIQFRTEPTVISSRPKFTSFTPVAFGQTNETVKQIQDILKFEQLFPSNVDSTGLYGAITARAIYNFQVKHNVAPLAELDALQGRTFGVKTIGKFRELYS